MLRKYLDIISKLGRPEWWDGQGAPRYVEFHPDLCGVYDRYIAFMEIGCQSCDATFLVASEINIMEATSNFELPLIPVILEGEEKKIAEVENKLDKEGGESPWFQVGSFHYGDPPPTFHKEYCMSGPTMNSVPIRIIEFWEREKFEWVRNHKYEFEFTKQLESL